MFIIDEVLLCECFRGEDRSILELLVEPLPYLLLVLYYLNL